RPDNDGYIEMADAIDLALFEKLCGRADDKPTAEVILIWDDGHVANLGAERTFSTGLDDGRNGLAGARHQRLDAAVPTVSDPAAQPQARGGTCRPKTVSHALHRAGYPEANGFLQCPVNRIRGLPGRPRGCHPAWRGSARRGRRVRRAAHSPSSSLRRWRAA